MNRWARLLEKLLPAGSDDAARAALRSDPEKYDQYLKALDEVYGPREQRAKDMGFDTDRTWYHGTTADITQFDPSWLGSTTNANSAKQAFFFSDDPITAAGYASLAGPRHVLDAKRRLKLARDAYIKSGTPEAVAELSDARKSLNALKEAQNIEGGANVIATRDAFKNTPEGRRLREIRNLINDFYNPPSPEEMVELGSELKKLESLEKATEDLAYRDIIEKGANVIPVKLKSNKPKTHDYKGQQYRDLPYSDALSKAKKSGHDSVIFKNTFDEAMTPEYVMMDQSFQSKPSDIAAVFDPSQIRSINAAFDPRFKKSRDILAGTAGATALGAAAFGGNEAEAAPLIKARQLADEYAKIKGLGQLAHDMPEAKVKVDRAKKIAQAYEDMKHDPNNPEVKKAYDALIKETIDQFKLLQDRGLKVTKLTPEMPNPYPNSEAMIKDIAENNHLYYFPTEAGFGTDSSKFADHPLLQTVDVNGEKMPANDIFRIVHDYFGHAKEGLKFGPKGEENAWRQHMKMYSPEAQKALTTETRGQNSWVNYGPHGEMNRANPSQTKYADQKAGLLPDWAYDQSLVARQGKSPTLSSVSPFSGLQKAYNLYDEHVQKPVSEAASNISDFVLDTTSPLQGEDQERFKEENKPILDTAIELGIDPLNFIPVGGLGKLGVAGKKASNKVQDAIQTLEKGGMLDVSSIRADQLNKLRDLGYDNPIRIRGDQARFPRLLEKLK